jgi:hypothetical protein
MEEQHLGFLRGGNDLASNSCDSLDDDSTIEITSMLNKCENESSRLSTYLQLEIEDGSPFGNIASSTALNSSRTQPASDLRFSPIARELRGT